MSALVFPDNPYIDQIYSQNGKSWKWNGAYWESYNAPVSSKSIRVVQGDYEITKDDGNAVCISTDGDWAATIRLTEEVDDLIQPGFRIEMWRLNAPIGFKPDLAILVLSPQGQWVDRLGGRAVAMKVADRTWMMTGDLGHTPDEQVIETESNDPITTDN